MKNIFRLGRTLETLEMEHKLDKDSLIQLLNSDNPQPIYDAADRVRKKYVGDDVHLRGLIEFSSYCCKSCAYCGLRCGNRDIKRFRMEINEIKKCAEYAASLGLKTVVLQSTEDKSYSITELCRIIDEIKTMDVAVTLSIGEKSREEYRALKNAGADRYLIRIETTNKELYEKYHPGMSYESRLKCLYDLKDLGYEVGTGCLIGLPGQTSEMLIEDIFFFKELDADMIGMGPFIPSEGTPMAKEEAGKTETVLKMMALTRLLMPNINMPTTTALGIRDNEGHRKGLRAGGNVIMPNVGMNQYRELYTIYPGKGKEKELIDAEINLQNIKELVWSEGRRVGKDYGNSQHFEDRIKIASK